MTNESKTSERKSIFVTGGASGIGRATCQHFAQHGWFVGAYDVDEAGLATLEKELGSENCLVRRLDVSDKAEFDAAMAEFSEATGGRLDLLFNNAGIGAGGWFEEVPYEVAMRIIDVNFIGVVNGVYAGIPLLKRTPNSLCFTTSSSAGIFGMPRTGMYAATKFAVKGLTEALSVELARFDSRASDMMPALVDTAILAATLDYSGNEPPGLAMKKDATPEGPMRLVQPEEVAELVMQAYDSNRVHWYIPAEMEAVEKARANGVEGLRDNFINNLGDDG